MSKPRSVIDGRGVASIASNATYLLAGSGVYFLTRFLYAVILARVFSPNIYGMINYGIALYLLFIPLTKMGLEIVISRDVGQDRQQGGRTALITFTLRIMSIAFATVAYIVLSWFIEGEPTDRLIVFVFSFALIGRSLAMWTENIYTAYEANRYSLRQQSIFRPMEVLLGLLVVFVWRNPLLVVVVHGLVWCLEAIYGLAIIHYHLLPLRLERNPTELCRVFVQGLPLGAALLLLALPYQGPLIFFRHLTSDDNALGQLALAMQVLFMLSQIMFALGSVALPVLSRSAVRQDGKDCLFAETAIRFSLFFGTAFALLGMAFGPWLTVNIFGGRYIQAGGLVGPVLWLIVPWATGHVLARVLMARKLDSQLFFCALAGAIIFSLSISEAVLRCGVEGAIWSAGTGMSLTTLLIIFVLHSHLTMDLQASLIKPGMTVLLTAGGFYFLMQVLNPILSFFVAFVALVVGCRGCLTPQDMLLLGQTSRWFTKKISSGK